MIDRFKWCAAVFVVGLFIIGNTASTYAQAATTRCYANCCFRVCIICEMDPAVCFQSPEYDQNGH